MIHMNNKININPSSTKWLEKDDRVVADYFCDLGFRSLKQILDMRVFDLMNMQGLNAVRVEEVIICLYKWLNPNTAIDEAMLGFVKEAFLMEKERQELLDLHCEATVDGYTDFIFINRFGQPQHQATLNKAIRRIIRDCNDEQLLKDENAEVLLPHFSCHSLRHTFTTRMCEAGVNVKVIQDTLGHKDISTTLNIYTDVTKELRKSEFEGLDSYFKNEYNKVSV